MRKQKSQPIPAFTEPMEVSVIDGEVVISGPQWLHASLDPAAAQTSADRLAIASEQAGAPRIAAGTKARGSKSEAQRRNRHGENPPGS